ncbi:terminase large subunit [Burkholderia plantarii]|uniref:terminase large subunit n=1 Tax=Burkholderia plantarii TaxID=41899 RepID=UPI002729EB69|nr:terminase TerL endonuclease subunit [Burkholderia plantarii]
MTPAALERWDVEYGLPMLRGEIFAGEFEFLAVLRHYEDLLEAAARGFVFSPAHAWHCINWIETQVQHIKGKLARTPLKLDSWQLFFTAVLIGWRRRESGLRRFRTGYEEVARKNGKSTWKAGLADYLFLMDREIGAEVYTIATTREQAMSVFRPALENYKRRVKRSPRLARSIKIYDGTNQERIVAGGGVFKPLPANAESLDGLNPSTIVVDELHAHRTRDVWDVMESALGAREQPLITAITTAGYILDGICTEIRGYLVQILRGDISDDTFYGVIFTLDDGDDPFDRAVWRKANPSIGSAKTHEYMEAQATKAATLPSAKANYLTKDLNIWVNGAMSWFDIRVWDQGGVAFDPRELRGRRCFGGLDLSSTRDLTSFVLVFPPDDFDRGEWFVLAWIFCPQAKVDEQSYSDAAPYAKWKEAGWLTVTDGNVLDYGRVRTTIKAACNVFDVEEVAFDVWNATHLANELMDENVPMVQLPQNFSGLSPGSKLLERLVYSGQFRHNANPVYRWCASNVSLLLDTNENIRPNKKTSEGRIDPIVATCMAMTRALVHQPDPKPEIIAI